MAKTVNEAFAEFIRDVVNLDPDTVTEARQSRDNLLDNIKEFDGDSDFFKLYWEKRIQFGSFGRGTKCRPLDDIDYMVCLSANGCTYDADSPWDDTPIYTGGTDDERLLSCVDDEDENRLNSTKVINKFVKKLTGVREYHRSEVHKNGQAAVLNLVSKEWSFDIVPCFYTTTEANGRNYYLIPNGKGNWMKTDPVVDRDKVEYEDVRLKHRMRLLVRMMKRWNRIKKIPSLESYALETLVVNKCQDKAELCKWPDLMFKRFLEDYANAIRCRVDDIKGIQGDLNSLDWSQRCACRERALQDKEKAERAGRYEQNGEQETAINLWREVFGEEFPKYG